MRITAIIPTFNYARYIGAAIESVLAQSRQVDEIIVVDDGSTDETASVLQAFGKKIQVIDQPNLGGATALNVGLEAATGDIFCFLDADDIWTEKKTEAQAALLSADPEIEAVFGLIRQFVDTGSMNALEIASMAHAPQAGISKNSMMIRRVSLERVGNFNSSLHASEFVEWYTRAMQHALRIQMIDLIVGYRRLHGANTGRVLRHEQVKENLRSIQTMLTNRRAQQ